VDGLRTAVKAASHDKLSSAGSPALDVDDFVDGVDATRAEAVVAALGDFATVANGAR